MTPRICLLIYTYNRANIVVNAIESVLNQTCRNFELVLINNGSTDNSAEVLERYRKYDNVRIIHLKDNLGSVGGINYAFDQINGEWFGVLGDDDLLMENAFEEMMRVVDEIDPSINAVTCNGLSTATGKFAGKGLDKDQYLPIETIIQKTSGDFFGLTKTELLGGFRLNEKLIGDANTLWYKIDVKAKRYYIHKALMVYNDRQGNTETSRLKNTEDVGIRVKRYKELLKEEEYWEIVKKYNRKRFQARCLRGMFFMKIVGDKMGFNRYKSMLYSSVPPLKNKAISCFISLLPSMLLSKLYQSANTSTPLNFAFRLFFKKYSTIS